MLNYYQPHLRPFLSSPGAAVRGDNREYYFHSFEDGLWAIIDRFFPGKKLHFLVPDFYCSDVLDNLKSRGHHYTYYPLDDHFQISSSRFKKYLWLFNPDIVIIFHAAGISSGLFSDKSWLPDLPKHTLLIEDSVHRLVDPAKINFINNRHFIIDSLRKVSPLPGSRLFASGGSMQLLNPNERFNLSAYYLKSSLFYLLFRLCLSLGFFFNRSALVTYAHEHLLRRHDDIIGDSKRYQLGLPFIPLLFKYLNYRGIGSIKTELVRLYEKHLITLPASGSFYKIKIPKSDYGYLHVYPLGYRNLPSDGLIRYLHSVGIPVWFKFTDSPWSQKRGVLYLPLGSHIKSADIARLVRHLNSAQFKSLK